MIQNTIKQLRQQHNITQEQLAKDCNVSRQTIIAIEKGNYVPSLLLALQISALFKQPVEKIFTIQWYNLYMKLIIYYLSLLVFIAVVGGFMLSQNGGSMGMNQMLGVSAALVLYTVAMSLIGEGSVTDERDRHHRYLSNRAAMITGTIVFSIGIMYQLFVSHSLDYWLLIGLITMNLSKIVSLIFLNYRK